MRVQVKIVFIGMLMGLAELVPGISGGTIAFITGIYQRLIQAIAVIQPAILLDLKRDGLKACWIRIDGTFLISLLIGMGISVYLFASFVKYLLNEQTILTWSFFFGLVLGSVWLISQQIKRADMQIGLLIGFGAGCGFIITHLVPLELAPSSVNLFIGGAIAICAWILPGLSGSFILLVLGLYHHLVYAITEFDILFLLTLAAGCVLGIMSFARLLNLLFQRYRDATLSVLCGFMLGSLVKLWPWQNVTSYQIKADGSQIPLIQNPVSPSMYAELSSANPEISLAVLGLLLGFVGVIGLNLLSKAETASTLGSKH